jgi:MYXO-CTERM domain-containing protein
MKRFALASACVLAMMPAVASAALSISIGPDVLAVGDPSAERFFDLVFHETGPATNEGVYAYDLYIKADRPGIKLVRAEKSDNWVFSSPGASFQEAGPEFSNKPGLIVVNAVGDLVSDNQDIVDGTKAARVFYTIDENLPRGAYSLTLDPSSTLFVSGFSGETIPVDISDRGTVIVEPEPTALPLLAVAGVLAVRRRRS